MQTEFKSLANIKKRVPGIYDLRNPYKTAPISAAKLRRDEMPVADAWVYRIVLIVIAAVLLKIIISALA